MNRLLMLISLLCMCVPVAAQDNDSTGASEERSYTFTGQLIGGYVRDLTEFEDTRNDLDVNRNQFSVAARFLWRPGNLLSGGMEIGYMNFYSVSNDSGGKAVRSVVPMYLVFSMTAWDRVDFGLGYGIGILSSDISGRSGDPIVSSTISTAWFLSAGYRHPINDRLSIGGEARYSNFDKLDDRTLSISAVISYQLFEY